MARKGDEHERRHLEPLRERTATRWWRSRPARRTDGLRAAAARTREAMRAGAPVIFQARPLRRRLARPRRLPRARRAPLASSATGATRSSTPSSPARSSPTSSSSSASTRSSSPRIQGVAPEQIHVVLGTGERKSSAARRLRRLLPPDAAPLRRGAGNGARRHLPGPGRPLRLCRWSDVCDERRADDHLSLVARMAARRSRTSARPGITTVAELAERLASATARRGSATGLRAAAPAGAPAGRPARDRRAELRAAARPSSPKGARLRAPARARRRATSSSTSRATPSTRTGSSTSGASTYLEDGEERFTRLLGPRPRRGEAAFEAFIDFVIERRERYPDMHVYHYAPYEPTALKRLMGLHAHARGRGRPAAARERARRPLPVVEQALRISQPSYSIKKVEAFYMEPSARRRSPTARTRS